MKSNMSDILTQEEIDALLKGGLFGEVEYLTDDEISALSEVANIGLNSASEFMISEIKKKVDISIKNLSVLSAPDNEEYLANELIVYEIKLGGKLSGNILLLLVSKDVATYLDLILGKDGTEKTEVNAENKEVLRKAIAKMLPTVASALEAVINSEITLDEPREISLTVNNANLKDRIADEAYAKIDCELKIGEDIQTEVMILLQIKAAKKTVDLMLKSLNQEQGEEVQEETAEEEEIIEKPKKSVEKSKIKSSLKVAPPKKISDVKFQSFDDEEDEEYEEEEYDDNLDFIMDVPLQVTVELGRTTKSIREILELNVGSIVELNNVAESFVDVLVNGKLIARGEVIVVDENFGVRIMEIYSNNTKNMMRDK